MKERLATVEEAVELFLAERRSGATVRPADFAARFPALAPELHDALDDDLVAAGLTACLPADCVTQAAPLVVPDTIKMDLGSPAGFPNGRLLTDPVLFNRLTSLTERFEQLLNQLNSGQGTAGQLLKDKQLYENMNGTVAELRNLLAAISKDPKRYLNVKISIF